MKQATRETRERALAAFKAGTSINQICEVLGITRKTFYHWRMREAEGGEQVARPKGHYPAKLTQSHLDKIRELVEANSSIIAREIRSALGVQCTLAVIYRALAKLGYTLKKRQWQPVSVGGRTYRKRERIGGSGKRPSPPKD